jgi:hypothetical protein
MKEKLKLIDEIKNIISRIDFSDKVDFFNKPYSNIWEEEADKQIIKLAESFEKNFDEIIRIKDALVNYYSSNLHNPEMISPELFKKITENNDFKDLFFEGMSGIIFPFKEYIDQSVYQIYYSLFNCNTNQFFLILTLSPMGKNYKELKNEEAEIAIKLGYHDKKERKNPMIYYLVDLTNTKIQWDKENLEI